MLFISHCKAIESIDYRTEKDINSGNINYNNNCNNSDHNSRSNQETIQFVDDLFLAVRARLTIGFRQVFCFV